MYIHISTTESLMKRPNQIKNGDTEVRRERKLTVTRASTLWKLLSSTRISMALRHRAFTEEPFYSQLLTKKENVWTCFNSITNNQKNHLDPQSKISKTCQSMIFNNLKSSIYPKNNYIHVDIWLKLNSGKN